jgi:hypothetical protein
MDAGERDLPAQFNGAPNRIMSSHTITLVSNAPPNPILCLPLCSTISVDTDGGGYARRSCGTLVGCCEVQLAG